MPFVRALFSLIVGSSLFLCGAVQGETTSESPDAKLHPIIIENPPTLGRVTTDLRDAAGRPIGIACETCHGGPEAMATRPDVPANFHEAIALAHGNLECNSCHAPGDRTRLRLANGKTIEMGEVLQLCSQCHGTQYRSYQNMAHGGSRGYWDRTKGPTYRNSCVACHAAHAPAYPLVRPAPGPNDRYLARPQHEPESAIEETETRHE